MVAEDSTRQKTTAIKSTEAAKKVRGIVKSLYRRAKEAKEQDRLVSYCMVGSQYDEILRAMDIEPVWTENFGGLCAAKRAAEPYLEKAEAEGFSQLICGYARTGIGFDILRKELGQMPPDAPDGGMPEPDLLLGSSMACDVRFKWYQSLASYLDIPIYNIDVLFPPIDANLMAVRDYYIQYQAEQFKGLIAFLEKHSRERLDYDRLWETIKLSDKANLLWWEAYELRKAIPCPMPGEDAFTVFVPGRYLSGEKESLDFYQELYQELKCRVHNKIGVIPNERYRLLWGEGFPLGTQCGYLIISNRTGWYLLPRMPLGRGSRLKCRVM